MIEHFCEEIPPHTNIWGKIGYLKAERDCTLVACESKDVDTYLVPNDFQIQLSPRITKLKTPIAIVKAAKSNKDCRTNDFFGCLILVFPRRITIGGSKIIG